jgi:hypothetical protein
MSLRFGTIHFQDFVGQRNFAFYQPKPGQKKPAAGDLITVVKQINGVPYQDPRNSYMRHQAAFLAHYSLQDSKTARKSFVQGNVATPFWTTGQNDQNFANPYYAPVSLSEISGDTITLARRQPRP